MNPQENKDNLNIQDRDANQRELDEKIDARVKSVFSFTARKLTDTPIDDLMFVNRKYVNLNGTTANRPVASVTGQRYFDTTIGRPVYWNGSTFVDGAGSIS